MKEEIYKLIEFDENIRKEVEEQHNAKLNLKKSISEEKKSLSEQAWQEARDKIAQSRKEVSEKMSMANIENQAELAQAIKKLQMQFDENKAAWVNEITSHILKG